MYIITDQNDRISAITPSIEKQEVDPELQAWNYIVNDGAYAVPASGIKGLFQLNKSDIPPAVEPFIYCYDTENGFYLFEQQQQNQQSELNTEEEIING